MALGQEIARLPKDVAGLVAVLDGKDIELKCKAAGALEEMSPDKESCSEIVAAGAVRGLLALLAWKAPEGAFPSIFAMAAEGRKDAACVLRRCAAIAVGQKVMMAAGAIPRLVALLEYAAAEAQEKEEVAGVLENLASTDRVRAAVLESSVVPLLCDMLVNGRPESQAAAAGALAALPSQAAANFPANGELAAALFKAGVLPPLVSLLERGDVEGQRQAARALGTLASGNDERMTVVMTEGLLPGLVALMKDGDDSCKQAAVKTMAALAERDDFNLDVDTMMHLGMTEPPDPVYIARSGALPPLVALLSDPDVDTQENAVLALFRLGANGEIVEPILAAGALRPLCSLLFGGPTGLTTGRTKAWVYGALGYLSAYPGLNSATIEAALPNRPGKDQIMKQIQAHCL